MAALDEAHIGVDEGEPEAQVVVPDLVETLFALLRIGFSDGDLPR